MKTLRVLAKLNGSPLDVVPTYMGAGAVPPEYEGRPHEYIDWVVAEMLPVIATPQARPIRGRPLREGRVPGGRRPALSGSGPSAPGSLSRSRPTSSRIRAACAWRSNWAPSAPATSCTSTGTTSPSWRNPPPSRR